MRDTASLADRAVEALALLRDMDKNVGNGDPERLVIRSLKQTAGQILSDAFARVGDLAAQVERIQRLAAEANMPALSADVERRNGHDDPQERVSRTDG